MNTPTINAQLVKLNQNSFLVSQQSIRNSRKKFQAFMNSFPSWRASLFDEYFFENTMVPILKKSAGKNNQLVSRQIALAWANQVNLSENSLTGLINELVSHINNILR